MIRKLRNWEQTKISGRVLLSLNLRLYLEISQDFEDLITVYLVINGIEKRIQYSSLCQTASRYQLTKRCSLAEGLETASVDVW